MALHKGESLDERRQGGLLLRVVLLSFVVPEEPALAGGAAPPGQPASGVTSAIVTSPRLPWGVSVRERLKD